MRDAESLSNNISIFLSPWRC